jgi:predicted DNA-binding protein
MSVAKTKRNQETIYLDPDRSELLDELSKDTRVPKQVYLREALDDLLVKYGKLKAPKSKPK